MTYEEQLSDPRWKAKRKIILERDNHTCTRCGARTDLQVHHKHYLGMAWEAPNYYLVTLCRRCHETAHGLKYNYYGPFTMMNLWLLAYSNEAITGCVSTFNALLSAVIKRNEVWITHETLAAQTNKSLPTITRHIRQLCASRLIVRNRVSNQANYFLHPLYLWKGASKQRDDYWASLPSEHVFKQLLEELATGV